MKHFKKCIVLLLLVGSVCCKVNAQEFFEVDGFRYCIATEFGHENEVAFCGSLDYDIQDIVIPNEITYKSKKYPVTIVLDVVIPSDDRDYVNLKSVTLPSSIAQIVPGAFFECRDLGLERINISDLEAFCKISYTAVYDWDDPGTATWSPNPMQWASHLYLNGTELTELMIPSTIDTLQSFAFSCCKGLKSVTIPNHVTTIGDCAFHACSNLDELTIGNSIYSIGYDAFMSSNIDRLNITDVAAWCGVTFAEGPSNHCGMDFDAGYLYGSNPVKFAKQLYINGVDMSNELVIPTTVTSISKGAFYNSKTLTSVTIPNSVVKVSEYSFFDCDNLKNISVDAETVEVGAFGLFGGTWTDRSLYVTIGSSVKNLYDDFGESAIRGFGGGQIGVERINITDLEAWCNMNYSNIGAPSFCLNDVEIKDLVIPDGIRKIRDRAFIYCSGLKSVTFPTSVTEIGNFAFKNCSGLTSIDIPTWVTTIGEGAFEGCRRLTSVDLSNRVTTIGEGAFEGCSGLTEIDIPASVTTIGRKAFYDTGLKSIHLPHSVTGIESDAFAGCYSLKKVSIDDLEKWCGIDFGNSSANPLKYAHHLYLTTEDVPSQGVQKRIAQQEQEVTDLVIPESVSRVGDFAFYGCSGLSSLTIPNTVAAIGDLAFSDVVLKTISIQSPIPPQATTNTFSDYSATLYVPKGAEDAYRNDAIWGQFATIKPINLSGFDGIAGVEDSVIFSVDGNSLTFGHTEALGTVEIYTLSGTIIYSGKPKDMILAPGTYIIRVDGNVSKITL